MEEHNLSESEQMYILSVALLEEAGHSSPVSLSLVSDYLGVATVTTNQMVHKLADQNYLEYLPYQGLRLTNAGGHLAKHVLRHRRLWQVFFESKLGLDSKTADDISCRLEHIVPCEAVQKLAEFLEQPNFTSQGLAVPVCEDQISQPESISLCQGKTGHAYRVENIFASFSVDQFLRSEGLVPNAVFRIDAVGQQVLLLSLPKNKRVQITKTISEHILVIPVFESEINEGQI